MYKRSYVKVVASFEEDGQINLQSIALHGQRYPINRVLDIRQAAATKAGGLGTRLTVRRVNKELKSSTLRVENFKHRFKGRKTYITRRKQ